MPKSIDFRILRIPEYRFQNLFSQVAVAFVSLISLTNARQHQISIQDLTHDLVSPLSPDILESSDFQPEFSDQKGQSSIEKRVNYGHSFQYFLPSSTNPSLTNRSVQLYLVKPYKLRYAEYYNLLDEVIVNQSGRLPFLQINRVNSIHRGNYTFYQFEYHPIGSNRLVNLSRIDFRLVVEGLRPSGHTCDNNRQCDSGHCHLRYDFSTCVCTPHQPIYYKNLCHPARQFNESCVFDEECQEYGGNYAECNFKRCRCNRETVPIKLSPTIRHCVKMVPLHKGCLFSKQCSLAGDNRYCNGNYQCDCLPGYNLVGDQQCSGAFSHFQHSSITLTALTFILLSSLVYSLTS